MFVKVLFTFRAVGPNIRSSSLFCLLIMVALPNRANNFVLSSITVLMCSVNLNEKVQIIKKVTRED